MGFYNDLMTCFISLFFILIHNFKRWSCVYFARNYARLVTHKMYINISSLALHFPWKKIVWDLQTLKNHLWLACLQLISLLGGYTSCFIRRNVLYSWGGCRSLLVLKGWTRINLICYLLYDFLNFSCLDFLCASTQNSNQTCTTAKSVNKVL